MSNQREAFNKFCFTADITPSTEHLDIWKAAQMEMQKQLLERDAVIEQMREFVEAAINIGNEFGCLDLNYAEDYLALTPSESLAKHDAEVAAKARDEENEECAKVCDEYFSIEGVAQACSEAIRARGTI